VQWAAKEKNAVRAPRAHVKQQTADTAQRSTITTTTVIRLETILPPSPSPPSFL